jgi:hypothetical protein
VLALGQIYAVGRADALQAAVQVRYKSKPVVAAKIRKGSYISSTIRCFYSEKRHYIISVNKFNQQFNNLSTLNRKTAKIKYAGATGFWCV